MQINIKDTFPSKEEAEAFRERYYRNYHPAGYGTSLTITEDNGQWIVQGYRFSSCD